MMQSWFPDAKLGIFIHWGIYAVNSTFESWPIRNMQISPEDYYSQLKGFTAKNYDARAWARLFKDAGARYAVLTTKHHDGVALWDTKLADLSVVKQAPAGRDLVGPYAEALREQGLKVGLYFSHLDWAHKDYPSLWDGKRGVPPPPEDKGGFFDYPVKTGVEDPKAWNRFLKFNRGQLRELSEQYKPDLLWFDGDWSRSIKQWRMKQLRDFLHELNPNVVLNSRMGTYGDYATPEQAIPVVAPEGPWEFCMTINDSWGYRGMDTNWKTPRQIIRYFVETITMGGNLLLDIGPREDGTIPQEAETVLRELGKWIERNAEAVYGTTRGMPAGHFHGPSSYGRNPDTIYLYLFDRPVDQIAIKGLINNVRKVTALKDGRELTQRKIGGAPWAHVPGVLWIDVPQDVLDPSCTALKVELEGPVQLYRGEGQVITANP